MAAAAAAAAACTLPPAAFHCTMERTRERVHRKRKRKTQFNRPRGTREGGAIYFSDVARDGLSSGPSVSHQKEALLNVQKENYGPRLPRSAAAPPPFPPSPLLRYTQWYLMMKRSSFNRRSAGAFRAAPIGTGRPDEKKREQMVFRVETFLPTLFSRLFFSCHLFLSRLSTRPARLSAPNFYPPLLSLSPALWG